MKYYQEELMTQEEKTAFIDKMNSGGFEVIKKKDPTK